MAFAGNRVHQIRSLSIAAAQRFPDGFFDWVYIDALHTRDAALGDMRAWWPKLRRGGLFSGDDYGDINDTELMPSSRYRKQYGHWQVGCDNCTSNAVADGEWGVIRATQEFAREVTAVLHVTWMRDCYNVSLLRTRKSHLRACCLCLRFC